MVFTSGTAGAPRAVVLSDAALVNGVGAWTAQWGHRPVRSLSYLPVSHVAQRIMGHTLMCLYGTIVVASTPDRMVEDLVAHRLDTLLGVPQIWARLAAASAQDNAAARRVRGALAGVKAAVTGAAALDRAVAAALKQHAGLMIRPGGTQERTQLGGCRAGQRRGAGDQLQTAHGIEAAEQEARGSGHGAGDAPDDPLRRRPGPLVECRYSRVAVFGRAGRVAPHLADLVPSAVTRRTALAATGTVRAKTPCAVARRVGAQTYT
ncbi:AMP-binding protein [Streptomyces sp. NPDC012623]|uniref:AMP-binding protein n=1 Tax=unclassified Streptomyces TaxID=2593676 RepID=UPI0036B3D617